MTSKKIIFNWKMHGNLRYCEEILNKIKNINLAIQNNIIVCPPYTLLYKFSESAVIFGAQNCASETEGSYTGDVSAKMLEEAGCRYCIVGHSERRKYFFENTEIILQKIERLIESNIIPIICVRKLTEDNAYISQALKYAKNTKLVLAYEPEFAIGSGVAENIYSIEENINKIRGINSFNENVEYVYGGSVNEKNISEVLNVCDGVLIGKASVNLQNFNNILSVLEKNAI